MFKKIREGYRAFLFKKALPDGLMVEGTTTLLCICPVCEYRNGGRREEGYFRPWVLTTKNRDLHKVWHDL
jgi:hypothetical protein